MGRYGVYSWLISKLSGLRDDEDLVGVDFLNDIISWSPLEFHSRAIVDSAKVCWVVDIHHDDYAKEGSLSTLDPKLRRMNAIQALLNDCVGGRRRTLMSCLGQICQSDLTKFPPEEPSEPSEPSIPPYAVIVSAVVLLSLVYQYLTGNVDRGGSRAYSRSSLDFRDIYVAIVLFLGAYVWIKFREVAFKGVHPRKLVDTQARTKVVYDARLKPPLWDGKKVPRLGLGRFATPQEAHNKFLIAAFYYGRDAGLLDGWFQVPPMSEEERSLTGNEKRKWVIGQAKKVYKDFEKKKTEAKEEEEAVLLLQEILEAQVTPVQDEVNVDFSMVSLLNSAEHRQAALASQVEGSGMGVAMLDNHGLECTSRSFDGMHEGFTISDGHGSQEGFALPVSQLPPNTESGMSLNGSDPLDSLQTFGRPLQQQVSLLQQQSFVQEQKIQEFVAQMLQMQHQQRILQQQLQESRFQNPQWPCQFCFQQQQLQVVNRGFPSFELEMEQSMHQLNYPDLMAPPHDGGEVQEGFLELDTLMSM